MKQPLQVRAIGRAVAFLPAEEVVVVEVEDSTEAAVEVVDTAAEAEVADTGVAEAMEVEAIARKA
jgi:hypothetical protein